MPTQRFSANEIQGISPGVEPIQTDKIFALDGRNFVFDSIGPRSIYGDRFLTPFPKEKPAHTQGVRAATQESSFTFNIDGDGIWLFNEAERSYELLYPTQDTSNYPNRWTNAYLGGNVFFCHPRIGILVYDVTTGECYPHGQRSTLPIEGALAVSETNGRLCVLTDTQFVWSAPSDGLNFTPALGQAGSQLLADRVSGDPITMTPYAGGCLVWTTAGVLRSEFTGDAAVFRYKQLNTEYRPNNSFCTSKVHDDTIIILDERGLFKTNGNDVTPYAPLFNEFLADYIRVMRLRDGNRLRLEWDAHRNLIYVSVRKAAYGSLYEMAFVYYPPLDKWGVFNEPHYGLFPIEIRDSVRASMYFGMADSNGYVKYFLETPNREVIPTSATHPTYDMRYGTPIHYTYQDQMGVGWVATASGRLSTMSNEFYDLGTAYTQANTTFPAAPNVTGLNARLRFGLFRPTGSNASDETSEVLNIVIRNAKTRDPEATTEDYELGSGTEDYEVLSGTEDYGINEGSEIGYGLTITGTIDGVDSYMTVIPEVVDVNRHATYYACSCIGVWHMLDIEATEPGESFHVKTFEITATSAGRLL